MAAAAGRRRRRPGQPGLPGHCRAAPPTQQRAGEVPRPAHLRRMRAPCARSATASQWRARRPPPKLTNQTNLHINVQNRASGSDSGGSEIGERAGALGPLKVEGAGNAGLKRCKAHHTRVSCSPRSTASVEGAQRARACARGGQKTLGHGKRAWAGARVELAAALGPLLQWRGHRERALAHGGVKRP